MPRPNRRRPGLTGLDDELSSTGRIGAYAPQSSSQIAPGVAPPTSASRALQTIAAKPANLSVPVDRRGGLAEEEFAPTDGPVAACRVEVARRRQIAPNRVAAKEVDATIEGIEIIR